MHRRRPVSNGLLFGLTEQLRGKVLSAIFWFLLFFNDVGMSFRVRIVSISRHLPADFDIWLVRLDRELVVADFPADPRLSKLLTHHC